MIILLNPCLPRMEAVGPAVVGVSPAVVAVSPAVVAASPAEVAASPAEVAASPASPAEVPERVCAERLRAKPTSISVSLTSPRVDAVECVPNTAGARLSAANLTDGFLNVDVPDVEDRHALTIKN
jgi:hypothetical protein